MAFAERYGPWAVVFGGSEGIGASFARRIAAQDVNVVLAARRPEPLAALAQGLRTDEGVDVRTISVDLTSADFLDQVGEVTSGLDVGLVVWNAGATHGATPFLAASARSHLGLVDLNCAGPIAACHRYVGPMVERERGGIVLVGSMAGVAGCALTVTYSAAKAFEQVFAEGLWSELRPHGIDVLAVLAGATKTPALLRSGVPNAEEFNVMASDEVAAEGLSHLADGPVWIPGDANRAGFEYLRSQTRRDAAATMSDATRALWGVDE
jgi:uncharacterized protein